MTLLEQPATIDRTQAFAEKYKELSDQERQLYDALKEDIDKTVHASHGHQKELYFVIIDETQNFSRELKEYGHKSHVVMDLETDDQQELLKKLVDLTRIDPACVTVKVSLDGIRYHCRRSDDESSVGFITVRFTPQPTR